MTIGEKLKEARIERHLTQEQMAELLQVSRQAITKWESEKGLPDIENLRTISQVLQISIDELLDNTYSQKSSSSTKDVQMLNSNSSSSSRILIRTFDGKSLVNCLSVQMSSIVLPSKKEPKYILNGVVSTGFFGPHTEILAFYLREEDVQKEIQSIQKAMEEGQTSYELQYFTDVEMKGLSPKLKNV